MNPYEKLMARKRKWTPVKPVAGTCREGAEETIHRALALRHMELPVGDFITDALANEVPSMARDLLLSNVTDEENHDLALSYIADAYGVDDKAEAEAIKLKEAWIAHPDHTVLKAMVAERAISSYYSPFFGGMVMLECVPYPPTSPEMNKFMLQPTLSCVQNWDSDRLLPWINSERRRLIGLCNR